MSCSDGPRARRALLWTHEQLQSRAKRRESALLYVRSGPGPVDNATTLGPGTASPPFRAWMPWLARRLALALRLVLSRCSHLGHFASAFLSRPRSYGPRGSTFAPSWCADVCAPCSPCSKAASSPWEKSSSHRFGHQESSTPPWHQSRVDQCGSRTGRRDLPMVVVEFNRGAGSDAVVALDARVRGASLEKACCRGDNGDED